MEMSNTSQNLQIIREDIVKSIFYACVFSQALLQTEGGERETLFLALLRGPEQGRVLWFTRSQRNNKEGSNREESIADFN